MVVVAGSVNENYDINSPFGVIRAYDVKTGELKWHWAPGNPDSTAPIAEDEVDNTSSLKFRSLRYEGQSTPPSRQGTTVYPGNFGIFNWGSVAVDPERQVMFGMPLYLAFIPELVEKEGADLGPTNQGESGVNENVGANYAVEMKPFLSPVGSKWWC